MMYLSKSLLVAALAALASAGPVPSSHVVHEKRHSLDPRWNRGDRVHPDSILPMRIGLSQSNMDDAHVHLMDVSDPDSPNYGKHWTSEEVIEFFKPSDETTAAVRDWLVASGISDRRITLADNKAWFAFDATAAEAERLLHAEFFEFEDDWSGGTLAGCDVYHLPEHLTRHVDYVTPGIKLLAPSIDRTKKSQRKTKRMSLGKGGGHIKPPPKFHAPKIDFKSHKANLTNCDQVITPACVAALYQIPEYTGGYAKTPNPKNVMGIYEAIAQYYYQEDLDLFFSEFTPYIANGTHPSLISVDGGTSLTTDPNEAGGEVELDLLLSYPIVYPQSIAIWQEDDDYYEVNGYGNPNLTGGFNHVLDSIDGSYCTYSAFGETGDDPEVDPVYPDPNPGGYKGQLQCGVYKPTTVISFSYGGQEVHATYAYQRRQCNEFLKLGLQGVSFLFSSGDAGVGNYPYPYSDDGPTGCLGPEGRVFNPTWPDNCPWVTSVGATKVYPGHSVYEYQPESAVYDPAGHPYAVNYSSGGGFSNVYPVADYQKSAVASYFANHNPPYAYYSVLVTNTSDIPDLGNGTYSPGGVPGGVYNRIGRGTPDVAANGDNIAVFVGGQSGLSGGTSASCPIFASIINRINEERLNAGKSSLGFLNPTLYKHPEMFKDVVNGTNPGCLTDGFSAVSG